MPLSPCLYSSEAKAREPPLELEDFYNNLHEHPTLWVEKYVYFSCLYQVVLMIVPYTLHLSLIRNRISWK